MALDSIVEIFGRSAEVTNRWVRSYTRKWQVEIDDSSGPIDGPGRAIVYSGAYIGQAYAVSTSEFDLFAFCNKVSAEEIDGTGKLKSFIVTATYGPWDEATMIENPLNALPVVDLDYEVGEKVLWTDASDNPIVNSAGVPFDPPPMGTQYKLIITVTVNRNDFAYVAAADGLKNKVNSGTFLGFDARTVLCRAPKATREFHPFCGIYWRITYQFEIDIENEHQLILPSMGYQELDTSGKLTPILTEYGELVSEPMFLDSDGHAYPIPHTGAIYAIAYDIYGEADFVTALGFGG